jgi:nitrite reductase/ring-hydroxylating ferredoxin subunit
MAVRWCAVASSAEVGGEHPTACAAESVLLALLRIDGRIYAVEDRCPHMAFPLSQGLCRDGRLVCAWHHWEFNLREDQRFLNPEARCATYPAVERDGQVLVGIDRDALPPAPGGFPRPGIDAPTGPSAPD